jgi:nucleoside-diphosphate-sugar epimerase
MNKKILIVGGSGFIGSHLSKKCLDKNWGVDSLSLRTPVKKNKKVRYIKCDITNFKKLKKKIKSNYDYVVNLSGYIDHSSKKKTFSVHYNGCKNLIKIFKNKQINSFIQIGTSLEYGNIKSPHIENKKIKKIFLKTNYAKAKYLATQHVLNLYKKKKFPGIVLRFYQVYGQGQDNSRMIPYVIDACKKNTKFPCSTGAQSRDFLHVSDAVDAILKILVSRKKKHGEIFNVGYGKAIKIKTVILLIKKIVKKGLPLFGKIKLRKEESLIFYPSIKKIKKIINWSPKIKFKKGINITIKKN